MKKVIIIICTVYLVLFIGVLCIGGYFFQSWFNREEKEITTYLNNKYGSDKGFYYTNETYGGGIGINSKHYIYSSREIKGKKFIVDYTKDGNNVLLCDNYLSFMFYDDIEKFYRKILSEFDYEICVINPRQQHGVYCDKSNVTDDFNQYLKDKNSEIYADIVLKNGDMNIDKEKIAKRFIEVFKQNGILEKYYGRNYLASIYFSDNYCNNSIDVSGVLREEFVITNEGYKDKQY